MTKRENSQFLRIPGLYRLWDLQLVINRSDDYQVHYVELTGDGTPLFALYRRNADSGFSCDGDATQ